MGMRVQQARVARVDPRRLYPVPVAVVPRRTRRRWRPARAAARMAFYAGLLAASWSTVFLVAAALSGPPGAIWRWLAGTGGGALAAALGARWDERLSRGDRHGR